MTNSLVSLFTSFVSKIVLSFMFLILNITSFKTECKYIARNRGAFFIFGDSFYDPGNNNYINTTTFDQANFWPYGETFFKFPTGRFSDGRLVPDFIAGYANLPFIPPFLQPHNMHYHNGANFASAGAGALVDTFKGSVISLQTQLSYFGVVKRWLKHKQGNLEAKMTLSNGVYMFSIGSNDYLTLFLTNSTILNTFSKPKYVDMVIANLTTAIHDVYRKGARKFGFMNIGPLGCFPGLRALQNEKSGVCFEEASTLAKLHNKELSNKLSQLKDQLKGFEYSLYDFNSTLTNLINHPASYGFKKSKRACCGTGRFRGSFSCGGKRGVKEFELCDKPNDYVFWDSYHLTQKAYMFMAHQVWGGDSTIVKPFNLSHLYQVLQ